MGSSSQRHPKSSGNPFGSERTSFTICWTFQSIAGLLLGACHLNFGGTFLACRDWSSDLSVTPARGRLAFFRGENQQRTLPRCGTFRPIAGARGLRPVVPANLRVSVGSGSPPGAERLLLPK